MVDVAGRFNSWLCLPYVTYRGGQGVRCDVSMLIQGVRCGVSMLIQQHSE